MPQYTMRQNNQKGQKILEPKNIINLVQIHAEHAVPPLHHRCYSYTLSMNPSHNAYVTNVTNVKELARYDSCQSTSFFDTDLAPKEDLPGEGAPKEGAPEARKSDNPTDGAAAKI